jgi:hypothetical protein
MHFLKWRTLYDAFEWLIFLVKKILNPVTPAKAGAQSIPSIWIYEGLGSGLRRNEEILRRSLFQKHPIRRIIRFINIFITECF